MVGNRLQGLIQLMIEMQRGTCTPVSDRFSHTNNDEDESNRGLLGERGHPAPPPPEPPVVVPIREQEG